MPAENKFKPGNVGRPKGAKGKIATSVKEAFHYAFTELQKDPKKNLVSWAKRSPAAFYMLASKLIPVELKGEILHKAVPEITGFTLIVANENTDQASLEAVRGINPPIGE